MAFGSTMILSQAITRATADGDFVFHPRAPYVVFWVVDPDTGERVAHGERGQVVMNHISKGMFIPNNLERDSAIRLPGLPGQIGDSVSEVAPVATFEGEAVIEGVLVLTVIAIDALGPGGEYRTRKRELITDVCRSSGRRDEPRASALRGAHRRRATQGAAAAARRA